MFHNINLFFSLQTYFLIVDVLYFGNPNLVIDKMSIKIQSNILGGIHV